MARCSRALALLVFARPAWAGQRGKSPVTVFRAVGKAMLDLRKVLAFAIMVAGVTISQAAAATDKVDKPGDKYGIIRKPIPEKLVVLTFDDSCASHATFVGPLLKKYGFGGTFYVSDAFAFRTRKDWYMTWQQIKALDGMGFEIGNHTLGHGSLGTRAWKVAPQPRRASRTSAGRTTFPNRRPSVGRFTT